MVSKINVSPEIFGIELAHASRLWEEVICVVKLNFENFGRYIYFGHLIILLTERIWSPSPDFGRPKHGQNCPQPIFAKKAFFPALCIRGFSPFMAHPNISLCFRVTGRRVKFSSSLISLAAPPKTLLACCGPNFDASNLPYS